MDGIQPQSSRELKDIQMLKDMARYCVPWFLYYVTNTTGRQEGESFIGSWFQYTASQLCCGGLMVRWGYHGDKVVVTEKTVYLIRAETRIERKIDSSKASLRYLSPPARPPLQCLPPPVMSPGSNSSVRPHSQWSSRLSMIGSSRWGPSFQNMNL